MRILVLCPRDAAPGLVEPLLTLGHTVAVVSSTRGPVAPDVAGARGWTRGALYPALRSLVPEHVVALDGDEDAARALARVQYPQLQPRPEEHVLPGSLLDGDGLLELLAVLFPPVPPAELSEWLSGAPGGLPETATCLDPASALDRQVPDTEEPAPRRTRKRAQAEQEG